jgi:CheY-like chemotaxis protein
MATILVVDDDRDLRMMIHEYLADLGHIVNEARNGREAVRSVETVRPDLVICDIIMPEQDGIETIISLGRNHPQLPVLAISGKDPIYLQMAQRFGAPGLTKPFRLGDLLAAVERLLPHS